ncbi:MAG TPA: serine hydrolase, partial [Phaeodactylibacter sp.]|nr:serine hydrolase [Phaeodactylibacter sp.]
MKKHLLLPLLTGLLLLNYGLTAQPNDILFEDIDAFVEQARQDWQVPGVAIGIVQGNEIVHLNGYGLADREAQRPVDENTLFAIGSSTKAITAFSVLQLVDDGQLDLDQPVLDYLPDFRMYDDYVTHHLSVRDLLCHRSGLPRHDAVWYGSTDSRAKLFEKLKYLEPSAGFRETFQYQNLMFMAAGYLVGQTTGGRWEEAVQKRLFEPLEMKRANFSVDLMAKDPNHAKPYTLEEEEVKAIDFRNIDAVGPAGSVNASAREMCHWLIAQLNGGKYRGQELLSPSLLTVSHSSHMPVPAAWDRIMAVDNGGGPTTYGLGWFISTHKGRKAIQHGGNIDGFSAMVGLLPQDSVGVVVLTNLNGNMLPGIIRNYVFDKMLGEEARDWNQEMLAMVAQMKEQQQGQAEKEDLKQVQGTQPSHKLDDYAGTYTHPAYGSVKVSRAGDSLQIGYNAFELGLRHYHY